MKNLTWKTRLRLIATALGLLGVLSLSTQAGPPPDLMNSALRSHEQAEKVPEGATVAMVCGKCKSVQLSTVDKKKGFLGWFQPKTTHACPGCGGELVMKDVPSGQGIELSAAEFVHTCSKCGSDSAFCCATTSTSEPTKGMEKK